MQIAETQEAKSDHIDSQSSAVSRAIHSTTELSTLRELFEFDVDPWHIPKGDPHLIYIENALIYLNPECDDEIWFHRRLVPLANAARQYPDYADGLKCIAHEWSIGRTWGLPPEHWVTGRANTFEENWNEVTVDDVSFPSTTLRTLYFDAMQAGCPL